MSNNIRLSDLTQWVCWRKHTRPNGSIGKCPVNPHTGQPADQTNQATWGTLAQARECLKADHLDGVGVCLTTADPFLCIDMDNAIVDGQPSTMAVELMTRFQTYVEFSPSGNGLHLWLKSTELINRNMKQRAGLEVYSYNSFITWTGDRLPSAPNCIATGQVAWLVEQFSKPKPAPQQATHRHNRESPVDDVALWDRIFRFDRTQRLRRLYDGDVSVTGGDHSHAVIITLNTLARYTAGDRGRMRRMLFQTGLPKDRWTSKRGDWDWLDGRINDAISYNIGA